MVRFEIAALFTRRHGEGKSAAISKLADLLVPSSCSYIVLALVRAFLRFENRQNSEFSRTGFDSRYLNGLALLGSNDRLWIETLLWGLGLFLQSLMIFLRNMLN